MVGRTMWVARDKEGLLVGFNNKPIRMDYNETGYYGWTIDISQVPSPETDSINFQTQISRIILPSTLFPKLKWEDDPVEVELTKVNRYYTQCNKCGKAFSYLPKDVEFVRVCSQPSSGYEDDFAVVKCPYCKSDVYL